MRRSFPYNAFWPELRAALTDVPVSAGAWSEDDINQAIARNSSAAGWLSCFARVLFSRRGLTERKAHRLYFNSVPRSTFSDYLARPSRMPAKFRFSLREFLKHEFAQIDADVPDAFIMCGQFPPRVSWLDNSAQHYKMRRKHRHYFLSRRPQVDETGHVAIFCEPIPFFCLSNPQKRSLVDAIRARDPQTFASFAGSSVRSFSPANSLLLELALGHPPILPFNDELPEINDSKPPSRLRRFDVTLVLSAWSINTFLDPSCPQPPQPASSVHWLNIFDAADRDEIIANVDWFLHRNQVRLHVIGWPTLDAVDARALGGVPAPLGLPGVITQAVTDRGRVFSASWLEYPRTYYDKVSRDDMASRRTRAAAILAKRRTGLQTGEHEFSNVCRAFGWKSFNDRRIERMRSYRQLHHEHRR